MLHKWVLVAVLCTLIGMCVSLDAQYFVDNNYTCFVSGLSPREPAGTDFCTDFASLSCCLPGYDVNTVQAAFYNLIPAGPGCGSSKHSVRAAYSSIRKFSCLPCDPLEPQYRFQTQVGDIVNGGVVAGSPSAGPTEFTWRVCRTFLYGRQQGALRRGLWGNNGSHFTQCGLMLPQCKASPVYNATNQTFAALDPSCTSTELDLLIPALAFGDAEDPAVELLSYVPQSIGGFQFVVVDDEDPAFSYAHTPCFGRESSSATVATTMVFAISALLSLMFL